MHKAILTVTFHRIDIAISKLTGTVAFFLFEFFPQEFRRLDARLRRGEHWAEGEETIERLFELVQLDVWASLASCLALPLHSP